MVPYLWKLILRNSRWNYLPLCVQSFFFFFEEVKIFKSSIVLSQQLENNEPNLFNMDMDITEEDRNEGVKVSVIHSENIYFAYIITRNVNISSEKY